MVGLGVGVEALRGVGECGRYAKCANQKASQFVHIKCRLSSQPNLSNKGLQDHSLNNISLKRYKVLNTNTYTLHIIIQMCSGITLGRMQLY